MKFLLVGRDGSDPEAPSRRAAARAAHLEGAARLRQAGVLVYAAALLDGAEAMTGSVLVLDFPDRAALDAWLAGEPYVTGGVWKTVEVKAIRPAPGF